MSHVPEREYAVNAFITTAVWMNCPPAIFPMMWKGHTTAV